MDTPPPVPPAQPPVMNAPTPSLPPHGSDRLWSVLSHLSPFMFVGVILPLVIYLVMKNESEYVACNAREALNFHLSLLIYSFACVLVVCAAPLIFAILLAGIILPIIAAVKSSEGVCYHYPLTLRLVY